jgi:hypothetical protein
LLLALEGAGLSIAQAPTYRSAALDEQGRLLITLSSGRIMQAPYTEGQVSFDEPRISPDHQTIGWLALYPFPVPLPASDSDAKYARDHPIAGALIIYRAGRIVHPFYSDQVFWDWRFVDDGRVAYSTGPTHGGAAECVLRDVRTGDVIARWPVGSGDPPGWAKELRR